MTSRPDPPNGAEAALRIAGAAGPLGDPDVLASGVPADGGMRAAMVKLSRALGHPKAVEGAEGQCVEAALIELAAARIAGVTADPAPNFKCIECGWVGFTFSNCPKCAGEVNSTAGVEGRKP